jgi:hypothetical protein
MFGVSPKKPLPGSAYPSCSQQPKQDNAPNHAAETLTLAPAFEIPEDIARAKCSRASNSVGREPAVISARAPLVDLDSPESFRD